MRVYGWWARVAWEFCLLLEFQFTESTVSFSKILFYFLEKVIFKDRVFHQVSRQCSFLSYAAESSEVPFFVCFLSSCREKPVQAQRLLTRLWELLSNSHCPLGCWQFHPLITRTWKLDSGACPPPCVHGPSEHSSGMGWWSGKRVCVSTVRASASDRESDGHCSAFLYK